MKPNFHLAAVVASALLSAVLVSPCSFAATAKPATARPVVERDLRQTGLEITAKAESYVEEALRVQRGLETFYQDTGRPPKSMRELLLSGSILLSQEQSATLPWQLDPQNHLMAVLTVSAFDLCAQVNRTVRQKSQIKSLSCKEADEQNTFSLEVAARL